MSSPLTCADIYTKAFTDPNKWKAACWLIGVIDPGELAKMLETKGEPLEINSSGNNKKPVDERNPDGSGMWTRTDFRARRFRTTLTDGPDW